MNNVECNCQRQRVRSFEEIIEFWLDLYDLIYDSETHDLSSNLKAVRIESDLRAMNPLQCSVLERVLVLLMERHEEEAYEECWGP